MSRTSLELISWFWEFGIRRDANRQITPEWLEDVYRQARSSLIGEHRRPSFLLWGRGGADVAGALRAGLGPASWGYGSDLGPAFPQSNADTTGIAFRIGGGVRKTVMRAHLCTQAEILRALGGGYAQVCGDNGGEARLRGDAILALLDDTGRGAPKVNAVEFVHDFLEAVDDLIEAGVARYRPLAVGRAWDRLLRPAILRNAKLRGDLAAAERVAATILWDGLDTVSRAFALLDDARSRMERLSRNLAFELDADTVAQLTAPSSSRGRAGSRLARARAGGDVQARPLSTIFYVPGEPPRMSIEKGREAIVSTEKDLAMLQAVLREICLRVEPAEFAENRAGLAALLNEYDVVDVPKLASASAEPPADVAALTAEEVVRQVFLPGKALMQAQGRLSDPYRCGVAVCVNDKVVIDDNVVIKKAVRGLPHANAVIGVDRIMADVARREDAMQLDFAWLTAAQALTQPTAETYGLSVDDPTFAGMTDDQQEAAADNFASLPGIRRIVRRDEDEDRLFAGFQGADAGLLPLLNNIKTMHLAAPPNPEELGAFSPHRELALVQAVLPRRSASDRDHRHAFMTLCDRIARFCARAQSVVERRNATMICSQLLRDCFTVRAEDLDPVPIQLGSDHEQALDYVEAQTRRWAERPATQQTLDELGLNAGEQAIICDTLRMLVPMDDIAVWLTREFGHLETVREAAHCRRYIATKLSGAILGEDRYTRRTTESERGGLQTMLDGWARPTSDYESTLHYERVVAPIIDRLADISDRPVKLSWSVQPGDEVVEAIAQSLKREG